MKMNYRLIAGVVGVCCLIVACSKKYTKPNEVDPGVNVIQAGGGGVPTSTALDKLFKDLRSTPERQCVTAGAAQSITFSKGTVLTFYPNSFKDKAGNVITSGTVCLDMIEMYKPGDMIANRATTVADNGILQSGGQVYIKATKDGQEVYANKYGIGFRQAAASSTEMHLYYGNTNNKDSVATWTKANTAVPGAIATGTEIVDSAGVGFVFDSCTNFTWINCDRLYGMTNPRTSVKLVLSSILAEKPYVGLVLHDINSVVRFDEYTPETGIFNLADHDLHKVPIGMSASVFVISCRTDGSIYYAETKNFTITENMSIPCHLEKVSRELLTTKLSEL